MILHDRGYNLRFLLAVFASTLPAFGCGPSTPQVGQGGVPAARDFSVHPFGGADFVNAREFTDIAASGPASFAAAVTAVVAGRVANPLLEVRQSAAGGLAASGFAAGGPGGTGDLRLRFWAGGVELLGFEVSASRLTDGSPFVLGSLPSVSEAAVASASRSWPDEELATRMLRDNLTLPGSVVSFGPGHPFYLFRPSGDAGVAGGGSGDSLVPVLRFRMLVDGKPFRVVTDGVGVSDVSPDYFEVSGSASVLPATILDVPVETALEDLVGNGTLTSTYLQSAPVNQAAATEPSEVFDFPESDPRFPEVQAYAHAQSQLDWFAGLGATWYGPKPLQIHINALIGNTVNNALFIPGDDQEGTTPSINIGDGDGVVLKNLTTDASVVRHEYGHHIIYQTLQTTVGESLVVHEALADSFVFFHFDAPCLGHTICPVGSSACIVNGQCLRTAENNFAYNDAQWQAWYAALGNRLGHVHGQVLSGLLWDLRKNGDMSPTDLASMTLKAVSYFKVDSGIRDFLLSVLIADRELFACKYDSQLHIYMKNRNLDVLIPDAAAGCTAIPAPAGMGSLGNLTTPGATPTPAPTGATNFSSSSSTKFGSCGIIGLSNVGAASSSQAGSTVGYAGSEQEENVDATILLLLAMTPALVQALRRKRMKAAEGAAGTPPTRGQGHAPGQNSRTSATRREHGWH